MAPRPDLFTPARRSSTADIPRIFNITESAHRIHNPIILEKFATPGAALRAAGALTLSPVTLSGGSRDWYGVSPVSVTPERQRRGIGSALMRAGLSELKALGANGCVLVGDPKYYERFGFRRCPELVHEGIPQEDFAVLPFGPEVPRGTVHFPQGFWATQ